MWHTVMSAIEDAKVLAQFMLEDCSKQIPHRSPVKVIYGMSFMKLKPVQCFKLYNDVLHEYRVFFKHRTICGSPYLLRFLAGSHWRMGWCSIVLFLWWCISPKLALWSHKEVMAVTSLWNTWCCQKQLNQNILHIQELGWQSVISWFLAGLSSHSDNFLCYSG